MKALFEGISEKNKNNLFTLLSVHIYTFEENKDILSLVKSDNDICIIDEGIAEIIRTNYDGNTNIIDELYKDSVFGTSLSSINSSEFQVITKEKTTVIVIDYNNLINTEHIKYNYYNIFLQNLFSVINEKIKERNDRIRILTKRTIRNKLLEYFKVNSRSRFVYLPFNFTSLADYLAIDRSAMTRELKYMKEERLIEIKGKRITLLY